MAKEQKNFNLKILGCVSPYYTNKDSCPGYLINLNNSKILLDCGPGVCRGLCMLKDLNNLHIFISHFHKDHYTDLYTIGYASYVFNKLKMLDTKIKVYIPKIEETDDEYLDYLSIKRLKEQYFEIIEYDSNSVFKIEDVKVSFMSNYHTIRTYSTKLEYSNGYSMVYASDLGYKTKENLVNFSKNVDLLLIESSFVKEDNQQSDFHLHAYEAAIIAKDANVKLLLLTHFWPEHNKIKYLNEAKTIFNRVKLATKNRVFQMKKI